MRHATSAISLGVHSRHVNIRDRHGACFVLDLQNERRVVVPLIHPWLIRNRRSGDPRRLTATDRDRFVANSWQFHDFATRLAEKQTRVQTSVDSNRHHPHAARRAFACYCRLCDTNAA